MIKCEVIKNFNLKEMSKIKNLVRVRTGDKNNLFVGDTFYCDIEMAKYLSGENDLKLKVVKIVEVIPSI